MSHEKSIIENYFFNLMKTLAGLLFPIITFAYSSRVLGVEGIGKVNFSKSYITYFTMTALLGMNYYGTREAAKLRDNKKLLSKFVQEMLMINGIATLAAYIMLIISILLVSKLRNYETLLVVNSMSIILQGLGMEWLYQALEEYRYIAVRSVIFQAIALILMFIFVKDSKDVVFYAAICVFATYGSYILNFLNARKYIEWHWFGGYTFRKHCKPLFMLFAMAVSIQLYAVLDSTMLGFLQGDIAVGKYTAAVKVNKMTTSLITAVGVVLIPRLSYYIGNHQTDNLKELTDKAYNLVFCLSVPIGIGLCVLSDDILLLFSGKEFLTASVTMKLLSPIVILIPFNVVTNTQTFVPMGKEKLILISTFSGAVMNIICNLLFIPVYAENGAAVATVLAEAVIAVICYINVRRYFSMKEICRVYYQYWVAAAPIPFIVSVTKKVNVNCWIQLVISIGLSAAVYFILLLLFRNCYVLEALKQLRKGGD